MELTVLGSGTCIPTADRFPPGLALSFSSHLILFDGGGGSLRQMPRMGLDYRRVDFHCLSHFHPDHASDLVPLLFALNYTVDFTRSLPLHLLGPRGLEDFYARMRGIFGHWIEARTYSLFLHEGEDSRFNFLDFSIRTLPMAHPATALGFRVEAEGRSLAGCQRQIIRRIDRDRHGRALGQGRDDVHSAADQIDHAHILRDLSRAQPVQIVGQGRLSLSRQQPLPLRRSGLQMVGIPERVGEDLLGPTLLATQLADAQPQRRSDGTLICNCGISLFGPLLR